MAALIDAAAGIGGRALAAGTAAVAALRTAEKPLHPRGENWRARVERHGSARTTGVGWLDVTGVDDALVRLSASVGLPPHWPDVRGLAMRVTVDDRESDLLLASTGTGPISRLLLPAREHLVRPYTSLMPYRTPSGPLQLAAFPRDDRLVELAHARPDGDWHSFAEVRLEEPVTAAPTFEPLHHGIPGLDTYRWAELLRGPAYRTARRSRDEPAEPPRMVEGRGQAAGRLRRRR